MLLPVIFTLINIMPMSTKLVLKIPYSADYKTGYLNVNKEPRRVVSLVRNDGSKTCTSYARYLMTCFIGKYLPKDMQVDHIDNDKMNDTVENYQLLSKADNIAKGKRRSFITLICPICTKSFSKEVRNINHKLKQGKQPCCSRSCGGKKSHIR